MAIYNIIEYNQFKKINKSDFFVVVVGNIGIINYLMIIQSINPNCGNLLFLYNNQYIICDHFFSRNFVSFSFLFLINKTKKKKKFFHLNNSIQNIRIYIQTRIIFD